MGTRALTIVNSSPSLDPDEEVMVMYRQFDGYPTGHGEELEEFLSKCVMVNGIPGGLDLNDKHFTNGFNDLAAQLITFFKEDYQNAGGFYIYRIGMRDLGEEYIYTIYPNNNSDSCELCIKIETTYKDGEILYNGLLKNLNITQLE